MAFDANQHEYDAQGFMIDKTTKQRVGLENPPPAAPPKDNDYPKWVPVHPSQVVRKGDYASTPNWPTFSVDRITRAITVLVKDADEEAKAVADINPPPKVEKTETAKDEKE